MLFFLPLAILLLALILPAAGAASVTGRLASAYFPSTECTLTQAAVVFKVVNVSAANASISTRVAGQNGAPIFLFIHGTEQSERGVVGNEFLWPAAAELVRRRAGAGGAQVLLPSIRGFGLSAGPSTTSAYKYWTLVDDMATVIADLARQQSVHVIGHGFGGKFGWGLAHRFPHLVASLYTLNGAHPRAWADMLDVSLAAREKQGYIRAMIEPADGPIPGMLPPEPGWLIYNAACQRAAPDHLGFSCRPGGYFDPVGVVGVPSAVLWATDDEYYGGAVLARTSVDSNPPCILRHPQLF